MALGSYSRTRLGVGKGMMSPRRGRTEGRIQRIGGKRACAQGRARPGWWSQLARQLLAAPTHISCQRKILPPYRGHATHHRCSCSPTTPMTTTTSPRPPLALQKLDRWPGRRQRQARYFTARPPVSGTWRGERAPADADLIAAGHRPTTDLRTDALAYGAE